MKCAHYLLFILFVAAGCKSLQSTVKKQESKPRYNIVYEGNKRLQLNPKNAEEKPVVEVQEIVEANTLNEILSVNNQKIEREIVVERTTEKSITPEYKHVKHADQRLATEPKLKPEHLGELGLIFSIVAVLLFFLAAGTGIIGIAGFAFLLLIFGFIFSLAGLKSKFKRQAIVGLIISGTIILLGLIALIFYLVRG